MSKAKEVSTLLAGHFKLSIKQCPTSEKDKKKKKKRKVPYASAGECVIYVMISTKSNNPQAPGVGIWYYTKLSKEK